MADAFSNATGQIQFLYGLLTRRGSLCHGWWVLRNHHRWYPCIQFNRVHQPLHEKAKWRYLYPMAYPIQQFSATYLRGRIFVAGGNTNEYKWLRGVAMFTPPKENTETDDNLGQWTRVDDLPIPYYWGRRRNQLLLQASFSTKNPWSWSGAHPFVIGN